MDEIPIAKLVAGVDEAGRGPLAGSVVAAAVILDESFPIDGLTDSKKLSASRRTSLELQIKQHAKAWAIAESSQLEGELASLPAQPRVMRAGTTASIADVTDRIAAIDLQLSDPETRLSSDDEEIFWRERVRLMKLLVKLRYAQAQRAAF